MGPGQPRYYTEYDVCLSTSHHFTCAYTMIAHHTTHMCYISICIPPTCAQIECAKLMSGEAKIHSEF